MSSTKRQLAIAAVVFAGLLVVAFVAAATIGAIRETGPVFPKAKAAQIAAMNRANFSRDEYRWVRARVFASAGLDLTELDLDGMRSGARNPATSIAVNRFPVEEGSRAANGLLVANRRAQLPAWLTLAFFGL